MIVEVISKYGRGVDTEVVRFYTDDSKLVVEHENGSEKRYQRGEAIAAACDDENPTGQESEING